MISTIARCDARRAIGMHGYTPPAGSVAVALPALGSGLRIAVVAQACGFVREEVQNLFHARLMGAPGDKGPLAVHCQDTESSFRHLATSQTQKNAATAVDCESLKASLTLSRDSLAVSFCDYRPFKFATQWLSNKRT